MERCVPFGRLLFVNQVGGGVDLKARLKMQLCCVAKYVCMQDDQHVARPLCFDFIRYLRDDDDARN